MRVLKRMGTSMFGATGILALALLAGRLSGLAREMVLAHRFGASLNADIALVLLALPDLLANLLLAGGLSAALVPRLKALTAPEGARLLLEMCAVTTLITSALAVLFFIWPTAIFTLFAPGLIDEGQRFILTANGALIGASIPLVALSGIVAAYHAAGERFLVSGLGTLTFNLVLIGALVLIGTSGHQGLAVGIFAGAGLRLAFQLAALPQSAWRPVAKPVIDVSFWRAFIAGIAASALAMAPPTVIRAAASLLGPGNVAMFNYAQKLVELPLGVVVASIGTVALTRLSAHFGAGALQAAEHQLSASLRLALMLSMLICTLALILAHPIVSVIFFRGAMKMEQLDDIVQLTRIALLSIPFVAFTTLATASLNAQNKAKLVMRAAGLALVGLVVFMAPGLILSSSVALMAAAVASQALLALCLARDAKICFRGPHPFANSSWYASVGLAVVIETIIALTASYYLNGYNILILASGGIGCALGAIAYFWLNKVR